jgi:hypothetical protein
MTLVSFWEMSAKNYVVQPVATEFPLELGTVLWKLKQVHIQVREGITTSWLESKLGDRLQRKRLHSRPGESLPSSWGGVSKFEIGAEAIRARNTFSWLLSV